MRETPTISGVRVVGELLLGGLSIDGRLVRGAPDSDIARFRFGRRTAFALKHPDYVDHVLHGGADRYHKSIEYELLRTVVGLSLFTDEDESWRRHRMMLNPVLARRHVAGLFDLMRAPVDDFTARVDDGRDRIELDMTEAMVGLTLDVVGSALFGHALGDFSRKIKPAVTDGLRGAEMAVRVMMVTAPPVWAVRAFAAGIHHAPLLPPPFARLQWVMRTVDQTVNAIIEERRRHPVESDDLLGLLLRARDEDGALSPRRVRDEATTFMLAGHETTANALAWMWYLLALNPQARERMLAEVDGVLGDGHAPTVADLRELPWTTACFEEAMRFYPPAWLVPRVAIADDEIDGHRIPRGSGVLIPIHAMHHDPRWWPDPEVYDPSRFLAENAKGRHRSAYLPFGGGRRVCIGQSFALMEATLITAMMSRDFVYDLAPGHPVEPEATLTLRPRHGLHMIARRRRPGTERMGVAA
jgi:cytochrome P450